MNAQTIVTYGSESYYRLLAAGWTASAPPEGDATDPMRVMTPPGWTRPISRPRRRSMGERAPADRRR